MRWSGRSSRGPGERTASPWCARPGITPPHYEGWASACSTTLPWRPRAALDEFDLARVLIVDWDVHHGNGTREVLYDSPRVFFFSTHQYPHYPGTGRMDGETGAGAGPGLHRPTCPCPPGWGCRLPAHLSPRSLEPLAERFRPELILVSAGYDAHWNDPLADLHLSLEGYWEMARSVVALAERLCGRPAGGDPGRRLRPGRAGVRHCRCLPSTLLGDRAPEPDPFGPCPLARPPPVDDVLRSVIRRSSWVGFFRE